MNVVLAANEIPSYYSPLQASSEMQEPEESLIGSSSEGMVGSSEDSDNDSQSSDGFGVMDDASTIATTFTLLQHQFQKEKVQLEGIHRLNKSEGGESDSEEEWEKMDKEDLVKLLKSQKKAKENELMELLRRTMKKLEAGEDVDKEDLLSTALKSIRLDSDLKSIRLNPDLQTKYSVKVPPWAKKQKANNIQAPSSANNTNPDSICLNSDGENDHYSCKMPPWAAKNTTTATEIAAKQTPNPKDEFEVNIPPWFQPQTKAQPQAKAPTPPASANTTNIPAPTMDTETWLGLLPQENTTTSSSPPSLTSSKSSAANAKKSSIMEQRQPQANNKKVSFPDAETAISKQSSLRNLFRRRKQKKPDSIIPIPPTCNIQPLLHSGGSREGVFLGADETQATGLSKLEQANAAWKEHYKEKGEESSSSSRRRRNSSSHNSHKSLSHIYSSASWSSDSNHQDHHRFHSSLPTIQTTTSEHSWSTATSTDC